MLAGCIPVSTNEVFAGIAEQEGWSELASSHDPPSIARSLSAAVALSPQRRTEITSRAREVIERDHSLARLMDIVAEHLRALAPRSR
jgi:hypothetical protein